MLTHGAHHLPFASPLLKNVLDPRRNREEVKVNFERSLKLKPCFLDESVEITESVSVNTLSAAETFFINGRGR